MHFQTSKINSLMDISKFIFALLVVYIHTGGLNGNFHVMVLYICRIAVPCFFIFSSYLFWSKKTNIVKFTKRIFTLYFYWSVIELPIVYNKFFIEGSYNTIERIERVCRDLIFRDFFPVSWYLSSLIIGMLIVYIMRNRIKTLWFISIFFYFITAICSTYYPFFSCTFVDIWNKIFGTPYTTFQTSIIFILFGKILAENKVRIYKKYCISLVILSIIFGISELYVILSNSLIVANVFGVVIISFCLSIYILNNNINLNYDVSKLLRNYSILIYLSHAMFLEYIRIFCKSLYHSHLIYFYVLFFSFVLSSFILFFSKRFLILKRFY